MIETRWGERTEHASCLLGISLGIPTASVTLFLLLSLLSALGLAVSLVGQEEAWPLPPAWQGLFWEDAVRRSLAFLYELMILFGPFYASFKASWSSCQGWNLVLQVVAWLCPSCPRGLWLLIPGIISLGGEGPPSAPLPSCPAWLVCVSSSHSCVGAPLIFLSSERSVESRSPSARPPVRLPVCGAHTSQITIEK